MKTLPRMPGEVQALVQSYDRDAAGNGQRMRELLEGDRQSFYQSAIEILRDQCQSRGSQYLISLLAGDELLVSAICESGSTVEQAVALAQAASKAGVMADVILAKYLAEHAGAMSHSSSPKEMQRLMDLLSAISDGKRILPCLMTLARHPNSHLQSKAVLMIGRINRNVKWVRQRLAEPDARVRANAVEALWGVDTEEVRELLRSAALDADNRVAGNALLALYRFGDSWSIRELLKMLDHESDGFRATAAWVMGESGDPRFTKALARMVGHPSYAVRTRAFAALGQIKAASAQVRRAGEHRVIAHFNRCRATGWRDLSLEIRSKDGHSQIDVLPTQLILVEDGREVVNYTVGARAEPPAVAITFVMPRTGEPSGTPFQAGALKALAWKRPSDLWSVASYIPAVRAVRQTSLAGEKIMLEAEEIPEGLPPLFTCDPRVAMEALKKIPPKVECSDLWSTIRRVVQVGRAPARGRRHLIVYALADTVQPNDHIDLVSALMAARVSVHAISRDANSAFENICQTTHGTFHSIASEAEVETAVEEMCLGLQSRYTVRYQHAVDAKDLRITVYTPSGWGEAGLTVPKADR